MSLAGSGERGGTGGRRYTDKAMKRWKDEFPWVDEHPVLANVAYCVWCKQTLQPKRDKLQLHGESKSHITVGMGKNNMRAEFKPIIIENLVRPVPSSTQQQIQTITSVSGDHHTVTTLSIPDPEADHIITSDKTLQDVQVHTIPVDISADEARLNSNSSQVQVHKSGIDESTFTIVRSATDYSNHGAELTASQLQAASANLITTGAAGLRTLELKDGTYFLQDMPSGQALPIKILEVQGDEINVGMINIEENSSNITVHPFAKIQANAQFPNNIKQEIKQRFLTGQGWDALWQAKGAKFKVHKFVLALFSPFLKNVMHQDETDSYISTPDLSCVIVKSILCLFYTGSVILTSEDLANQIEDALAFLECTGSISLERYDKTKPAHTESSFSNLSFETFRRQKRKKLPYEQISPTKLKSKKLKGEGSIEEIEENYLDDDCIEFDEGSLYDNPPPEESQKRSRGRPRKNASKSLSSTQSETREKQTLRFRKNMPSSLANQLDKIKVEMEDDENAFEEVFAEGLLDFEEHDISMDAVDDDENKENSYLSDGADGIDVIPGFGGDNEDAYRERYRDTKNRYYLKGKRNGKVKGLLSKQLRDDLFENPPDVLLAISVCVVCYRVFKTKEELGVHKTADHANVKERNRDCYIDDNKYKCPKCDEIKKVGHVVWFAKHLRYCGKDKEKANAILGPDDVDIKETNPNQDEEKDTADEDALIAKKGANKKIHNITSVMFGKTSDSIWGCRTCYEAFLSKSDLEQHRVKDHNGKLYHGPCYDESSKMYTCMYCNLSTTYSHLVFFIRHVKQCLVDPSVGLAKDHEEEGLDDDTTEEVIDPWGVINKPLKVVNQRSHWISESLFGKYIPIVYPCHVCYTAYADERDIKEHFSATHQDVENLVENGPLYNKDKDCYNCPVCKKEVCRNQKNSVYFTYHLQKCQGKTFTVSKSCPKCNRSFNKYRSYMAHQRTDCNSNEFLCHICSMGLKSRQDLVRHVQYVHSDARPFVCDKCPKRFKRKADLGIHEQSHNTLLSFSCEHCGKAFNQKRALRTHIQTHLSYLDKPHQCTYCSMRFVRKQTLDNHMSTHAETKRFACEICGVRVKTKDALRSHRKKVHKMIGPLPPTAEMIHVETLPAVAANTVISNTSVKEEHVEIVHFPL